MKLTVDEIRQLKEEIASEILGDNNGRNFLSAEHAEYIEVELSRNYDLDEDFEYFSVTGNIPLLKVFKHNGTWFSVWGDDHQFDEKEIICEDGDFFLKDVPGKWGFSVTKKFGCFQFEEIDAEDL